MLLLKFLFKFCYLMFFQKCYARARSFTETLFKKCGRLFEEASLYSKMHVVGQGQTLSELLHLLCVQCKKKN